jgi:hypothetical protein
LCKAGKNTDRLFGEDGSLGKTLHDEGVVFLFSKSSTNILKLSDYITHTEKEPLEIGGHLDEKLAVGDAVDGGDGKGQAAFAHVMRVADINYTDLDLKLRTSVGHVVAVLSFLVTVPLKTPSICRVYI